MKFYKQTAAVSATGEEIKTETHWSVSQSEASAKRAEWVRRGVKRALIVTTEVEVPTDKKGLQEFLNSGR